MNASIEISWNPSWPESLTLKEPKRFCSLSFVNKEQALEAKKLWEDTGLTVDEALKDYNSNAKYHDPKYLRYPLRVRHMPGDTHWAKLSFYSEEDRESFKLVCKSEADRAWIVERLDIIKLERDKEENGLNPNPNYQAFIDLCEKYGRFDLEYFPVEES